jgi:hypothetical protein
MRVDWITLPMQALAVLQTPSIWNIKKVIIGGNNAKVLNDTLRVYYPKGSYSPSRTPQGGIGFFASPKNIFPAEEVELKYEVYFNETFNEVYGGKLPGLFVGVGNNFNGASGGKESNRSASIRMAWRKNLIGEAYVYVPRKGVNGDLQSIQGFVENGRYGDSLWRGEFKFERGVWNNVRIRVKLNTFGVEANGELEVEVNGVIRKYDKIVWRTMSEAKLTAIIFATFFGGSTVKYATPVDTYSYFRNVQIK